MTVRNAHAKKKPRPFRLVGPEPKVVCRQNSFGRVMYWKWMKPMQNKSTFVFINLLTCLGLCSTTHACYIANTKVTHRIVRLCITSVGNVPHQWCIIERALIRIKIGKKRNGYLADRRSSRDPPSAFYLSIVSRPTIVCGSVQLKRCCFVDYLILSRDWVYEYSLAHAKIESFPSNSITTWAMHWKRPLLFWLLTSIENGTENIKSLKLISISIAIENIRIVLLFPYRRCCFSLVFVFFVIVISHHNQCQLPL